MSRHWDPGSTGWLSEAQFRALSPRERRALYASRTRSTRQQSALHSLNHAIELRGYRSARSSKVGAGTWLAAGAIFAGVWVAVIGPPALPARSLLHPASAPVRASFDYCYRGGGSNCVVDGDTFWIGGDKVRIAGIDAPETHPPRYAYEARLGEEATEKLHALLNSGAVTMTSIEHFAQSGTLSEGRARDRDVYGRMLRNVQVNGADVGEAMVGVGVAREYGGGRQPWC